MKKYLFIGGILNGQRCYTGGKEVISTTTILPRVHVPYVYTLQQWLEGDCITAFYAQDSLSREEVDTLIRGFLR